MNKNESQRGFTLIELLVVIAILAVLFGVTALALNGVGSNAEERAACAERDIVQTAIDVHMAQTNAVTVTTTGSGGQVGPSDFSGYLRRTTKYNYSWTGDGFVNKVVTNTTKIFNCP